jgi:transposase
MAVPVEFQEIYETAARRVNSGRHSKNAIRFYMEDGSHKKFELPPFNDTMLNDFVTSTCRALNNYPVKYLILNYEAWYLKPQLEHDTPESLQDYLKTNPRPRESPDRREALMIYYENADGTIFIAKADILTVRKRKRILAPMEEDTPPQGATAGRVSHFFQKARSAEYRSHDLIESIIRRN